MASIQNQDGTEIDLNLAPIIDCFVVLISFLLVSASFLAIGVFDAGTNQAGNVANQKDSLRLKVQISKGTKVQMSTTGKKKMKAVTTLEKLPETLEKWISLGATFSGAEVFATDSISYEQVIHLMSVVRKSVPKVILGGI